jgi:hypothetical protein
MAGLSRFRRAGSNPRREGRATQMFRVRTGGDRAIPGRRHGARVVRSLIRLPHARRTHPPHGPKRTAQNVCGPKRHPAVWLPRVATAKNAAGIVLWGLDAGNFPAGEQSRASSGIAPPVLLCCRRALRDIQLRCGSVPPLFDRARCGCVPSNQGGCGAAISAAHAGSALRRRKPRTIPHCAVAHGNRLDINAPQPEMV